MKEIHYRGGMLTFSLPESWKEEHFSDGGAAFYEEEAEHGSLNVSLATVQNEETIDESMVRRVAMTGRGPGEPDAERLDNGNFLRRFERRGSPDPAAQHVTFWMLANPVPPHTVRYAIFNYGAPPAAAGTDAHRACLSMLDEQIRRATFTRLTPEEVEALPRAARPWWKFW